MASRLISRRIPNPSTSKSSILTILIISRRPFTTSHANPHTHPHPHIHPRPHPHTHSPTPAPPQHHHSLLTLAIETSCDDTCVSVLQTFFPPPSSSSSSSSAYPPGPSAVLHFNSRRTSDHRRYGGIFPKHAIEAHTSTLAPEITRAIRFLPLYKDQQQHDQHQDPSPATTVNGKSSSNNNNNNNNNTQLPITDPDGVLRQRPDFISVTRGPGMGASLATGLNTAKGLALAWNVPLVGVHHMQAHALTPRLVNALNRFKQSSATATETRVRGSPLSQGAKFLAPDFPFASLLVSGGHTTLVHSSALTSHRILADADCIAVGDALDKCARDILPADELARCPDTSYAVAMEEFAFPSSQKASSYDYDYRPLLDRKAEMDLIRPRSGYAWYITPALADTRQLSFNFSGLVGKVHDLVRKRNIADDGLSVQERRELAQCTMRAAFEHIATRTIMVLQEADPRSAHNEKRNFWAAKKAGRDGSGVPADDVPAADLPNISTIVVAGGVACNKYLLHILRRTLDARGYPYVRIVTPPQALCTDNAAMIAWAGTEMYQAGYQSDPSILVNPLWPLDPNVEGGGVTEIGGWIRRQPSENARHDE